MMFDCRWQDWRAALLHVDARPVLVSSVRVMDVVDLHISVLAVGACLKAGSSKRLAVLDRWCGWRQSSHSCP